MVKKEPTKPEKKTIIVKKENDEYLRLSKEIREWMAKYKKLENEQLTLYNESLTLKSNDNAKIILNGVEAGVKVGILLDDNKKDKSGDGFGKYLVSAAAGALFGTIMENVTKESREQIKHERLNQINVNTVSNNVNMMFYEFEIEQLKTDLAHTPRFIEIEEEVPEKPINLLDLLEGVKRAKVDKKEKNNVNKRLKLPVKKDINVNPGGKIISSTQLSQFDYQALNFEGKWRDFFGLPSVDFYCVIHGKAGEGKSTFAIQFANYLAENFGVVLYVSGEEGFSKTMKNKFINNQAESRNLYIADLRTYEELINEVKPNTYNFIFIDSLDNMRIGASEVKDLRELYKNSAIITISQSTKDGKMRGSYEIVHDSDIAVEVTNGKAVTVKNRFLAKDKVFNIFESDDGQGLMPWNKVRG
ncbi:MAG: hypothetical protein NTW49_08165 [Bacteroidia bacterium]|nr:hypothetical protein [Bacteroidia bacterium]